MTTAGIIEQLTTLRQQSAFSDAEWKKRGLNPSGAAVVNDMEQLANICLGELIAVIRSNKDETSIKETLLTGIFRFKSNAYDTEEREFIVDVFHKISITLDIDITRELNEWLYGKELANTLDKQKKQQVILNVKSFECRHCKTLMKLNITAMREGSPNYWIIGKCNQCSTYNLTSTGGNVGGFRIENFTIAKTLDGNKNSEAKALEVLAEISRLS